MSLIKKTFMSCVMFTCITSASYSQDIATASKALSFNPVNPSLLFDQKAMDDLSRVLRVYELNEEVDISDITPIEQEVEIDTGPLPIFYFSSVVYRNAHDWRVWLNGEPYSSKFPYGVNETPNIDEEDADGFVRVSLLSKNLIRVKWKPKSQLSKLIDSWDKRDNGEAELSYQNRLTSFYESPNFDLAEGVVTFTVRSNQSFVAEGFDVVEGKVELDDILSNSASGALAGSDAVSNANSTADDIFNGVTQDSPVTELRQALSGEAGTATEGAAPDDIEALQKAILQSIFKQ